MLLRNISYLKKNNHALCIIIGSEYKTTACYGFESFVAYIDHKVKWQIIPSYTIDIYHLYIKVRHYLLPIILLVNATLSILFCS